MTETKKPKTNEKDTTISEYTDVKILVTVFCNNCRLANNIAQSQGIVVFIDNETMENAAAQLHADGLKEKGIVCGDRSLMMYYSNARVSSKLVTLLTNPILQNNGN
jgi:hypothetical protein